MQKIRAALASWWDKTVDAFVRNPKTTIMGFVAGPAALVVGRPALFHLDPSSDIVQWAAVVAAGGIVGMGLASKDHTKSGAPGEEA